MVMVVLMFILIVVMVVMVFVFFFILIMMMVMMFMLVFVIVVMMFMFIFVMVMMVFMFLFIIVMVMFVFILVFIFQFAEIFRETGGRTFHGFHHGSACQLIPGSGDDACFRIQFTDDIDICLQNVFINHLCSGEDHACGSGDLIIKEFLEVLVIDLASLGINDRAVAVQFQTVH